MTQANANNTTARPGIVAGQIMFYQRDPGAHGPLEIREVQRSGKVVAFSRYKEMELEYMPRDLCTAEAIAAQVEYLTSAPADTLFREQKISARLGCLVAASR
ncbi:hypothetical protein [Stutzerimonas stutzeri]|uniref:hypothetical protein n=1 Tax=Stutzerimonas stutzeri TaxID=316 RepID=UPI0015E421AC|nr:hypothetical protein [Stutzerimonas stutzeri]MBA1280436.1 hypothetical protein [Stutzerimonas stutzeri]